MLRVGIIEPGVLWGFWECFRQFNDAYISQGEIDEVQVVMGFLGNHANNYLLTGLN
jgi:hypothetical protein